jgi:hypothetical protein
MTATVEMLRKAVQAATRPTAKRGIGLAVGVFVGSDTVVHATGPVMGDSLFQIGSDTKVFTALALRPSQAIVVNAKGELRGHIRRRSQLLKEPLNVPLHRLFWPISVESGLSSPQRRGARGRRRCSARRRGRWSPSCAVSRRCAMSLAARKRPSD